MSERLTYTVEEAAELLGVSRGSAYLAAREGELPTLRLGRRLLVPRRALEEMLNGAGTASPHKENGTGANGAVTKGGVLNHGHRTSRGR